jgi:hypothetical protein
MTATLDNFSQNYKHGDWNRFRDARTLSLSASRTSAVQQVNGYLKETYGKNCLTNKKEFYGVVVDVYERTVPTAAQRSSQQHLTGNPNAASEPYHVYKVYIPELNCLPAPKFANDPVVASYPEVHAAGNLFVVPAIGSIVRVKYASIEELYGATIVAVDGAIDGSVMPALRTALSSEFASNSPTLVSTTDEHFMYSKLIPGTPVAGSGQTVRASSPPNPYSILGIVNAELQFWAGKKESDAAAAPRLKTYWDNLGMSAAPDVHWSAAFISYVINQVDPGFPKSSAHYYYASSAKEKKGGWSLFQTSGAGKIKAQVGDVLVKKRDARDSAGNLIKHATHGDLVYKIEGQKAKLAGGNLSDTAKGHMTLSVDTAGYYSSFDKYEVILKKAGVIV